ncbi:MAG TPA: LysM peptidoglycan-binding domain-containing protein [Aggregatilinea sp.]|uniref:LysM peptidoglycan-binding domain-containing protein n=1 Tax=Aggregatilinea sp. TaxID=2806333 RepID=UPI002BD10DB3|nr:LysM peptidoglycan-binding domain-containing protein [Aggregatilinea sp.]HML21774.1 LysM peptidoglycan-binding domain-containing protein [Aggregatilinea sp.]
MTYSRLPARLALALVLGLFVLSASACYKNAGENVQPTSNRVDLSDLETPTVVATSTPQVTATRVTPTTAAVQEVTADATDAGSVLGPTPTQLDLFGPTTSSDTVLNQVTPTTAAPGITTPSMSDIRPSATPAPTINPALRLTATVTPQAGDAGNAAPAAVDDCVHVVQSGDSLFSIAQQNNVALSDLVAANPTLLTAGENSILQLGWELQLPGCGAVPTPQIEAPLAPAATSPTTAPAAGGPTTHVVQAGDTVFSIARQYGVSVDAIVQANSLTVQGNVAYITVGQTLVIPAAQ